jgi:uncharacterized protein YkwD
MCVSGSALERMLWQGPPPVFLPRACSSPCSSPASSGQRKKRTGPRSKTMRFGQTARCSRCRRAFRLLEPLARRLVELTAVRRREADADLEPLETDPELLPPARAQALDMLERGYFDHVTPGGLDPSDRVALLHRRLVGGVGENLAEHRGLSAEQVEAQVGPLAVKIMDGLMQSPEHRENILNSEYTHLAIAGVAKGEGLVVVQLFEAPRAARRAAAVAR